MKSKILIILLLTIVTKVFTQSTSKTYLRHGHNYGFTYSYEVSKITINSDSTFTWKSWAMNNKKEWEKYKEYSPDNIRYGKIHKKNDFYILNEYIDGDKSDIIWTVKILDRKLKIYYSFKKGKLKQVAKYKRIKN